MKEVIIDFLSAVGQKIAMIVLVGTTALTTGTAVSKVINHQPNANSSPEIEQEVDKGSTGFGFLASDNKQIDDKPITEISPTQPAAKPTKIATPTTSIPKATVTPTPTKSPSLATNNTNRCIVTLFAKQYDVTALRTTHSGGDIFKCGTDMSSAYQSKHGTNMSRMTAYLYDPNNPGANTTNTSTIIPGGSDDREDESHEDRYVENHEEEEKIESDR